MSVSTGPVQIGSGVRFFCINMDLAMADRGYLNGDEVRADMDLDPVGLTERTRLENYIPTDMAGNQKKLIQEDEA